MLSLTRDEPNSIRFNGLSYQLNLSFDRVLSFYEALEKEDLDSTEKVNLGLAILVKSSVQHLGLAAQQHLLYTIFEVFINNTDKSKNNSKPAMDYLHDAKYIYASFLQAYKIDLTKMRGQLSWSKFKVLIESLPNDTKLKEVISIRTRKIPKRTKYNQDEISSLLEAKRYYALKLSHKKNYEESANDLFDILKAQAR